MLMKPLHLRHDIHYMFQEKEEEEDLLFAYMIDHFVFVTTPLTFAIFLSYL